MSDFRGIDNVERGVIEVRFDDYFEPFEVFESVDKMSK